MKFSWESFPRPIVALAPIAGYTDSPYRQIVKCLTDGVVCFSELTSVAALHFRSRETYQMLGFQPNEYPLIMQVFGKEISFFVEAGKVLEQIGVAGIDINMGCPTTKITSTECGAALLRNPERAAEIVHALSRAVSIPVSVKTRLGYELFDEERFFDFCTMLQDAGASLLTVHGRTRAQGFSGEAFWEPIYELKRRLKISVIGNGDIRSVSDAFFRLGNLDGVMIGRATLGDPWLIAEIATAFRQEFSELPSELPFELLQPKRFFQHPKTIFEKLPLIREHVRLAVQCYGERKGIIEMRKHLASYLKSFPGAKKATAEMMRCVTLEEVFRVFNSIEKQNLPLVSSLA